MEREVIAADFDVGYECCMRFAPVNEVSLKRIDRHTKNGFIVISAYRFEKQSRPPEDNEKDHEELCAYVRSKELGFITLLGARQSDSGESAKEVSLFIPYMKEVMSENEFDAMGAYLCEKYEQDIYIIGDSNGNMFSKKMNGDVTSKLTNITTAGDFSKAYSVLKNGKDENVKYVFEGIRTWNGVYAAKTAFDSGEIV